MKISTHPLRVVIFGVLVCSLHAKDPVLTTPGTATWTTESTTTGTRTVFTLSKNTVFDWEQLNLKSGSEMVFNFTGGKTVVNFLGGTGVHTIDGAVTSNGIVAFFSPTASLQVTGSIIAKGVTLSTLNADATEFSGGAGYKMHFKGGLTNLLRVKGNVEATDGDVVIGGERVSISSSATIKATQDVLIGGGREISVAGSGDQRLKEDSGLGYVLHLGDTRASRIEVAAGRSIRNQGTLNAGNGRIFLEVGAEGKITNESNGVIIGDAIFNGVYEQNGKILVPDEGDAAPAVSDSTLSYPALSRPDGTSVNAEVQTVSYSAPVSASGDAGRDSGVVNTAVASNGATSTGSSFSGSRGAFVTTSTQPVSYSAPKSAPASTDKGASVGDPVSATSATLASAPRYTRSQGSNASSTSRNVPNYVLVSTSGGVRKDASVTEGTDASVAKYANSKSLLQRSSFFGMRGGSTAISKR